jgi:hypothetical protein
MALCYPLGGPLRTIILAQVILCSVSYAQLPASRVQALETLRSQVQAFLPAPPAPGEPEKCGLHIISAGLQHRQELTAAGRLALQQSLTRPDMEAELVAGNFRIHYDTTTFNTPALLSPQHTRLAGTARAYADSVASMMSYVLNLETETLGYATPPTDGTLGGGPEYDIYIEDLGQVYGYTTPDGAVDPGKTSTSFIEIDNDFIFVTPDSNKGLPALRVTLAHEFHHAIQMGCYGYWTSDVYFHEMTSTWMEDVAYTNVNDYYNYVSNTWSYSHFLAPDKAFASNDFTMYSRAIWCHYMAKRFGDNAVRRTWEEMRTLRPIPAMDRVLHQYYATSFSVAFGEWAIWNFFTGGRANPALYYPEGAYYGTMVPQPAAFDPPLTSRTVEGALDDFATRYHEIDRQGDNVVLIISSTNLNGWAGGGIPRDEYTMRLSSRTGETNFTPVGNGVSVQLAVTSPLFWQTAAVYHLQPMTGVGIILPGEGQPFPQPFVNNGLQTLTIPIEAQQAVRVTVTILNAGMDLVTHTDVLSWPFGKLQAVSWDGLTNRGARASSGIYWYVLEYTDPASGAGNRTLGKLAVVKR